MLGSSILFMPSPPQQPAAPPPTLATYIRDLFKQRENLTEFDLCYYEKRKVSLCAHLLKKK
jgi:hypothetical protein